MARNRRLEAVIRTLRVSTTISSRSANERKVVGGFGTSSVGNRDLVHARLGL
jgi:hypothetical protein